MTRPLLPFQQPTERDRRPTQPIEHRETPDVIRARLISEAIHDERRLHASWQVAVQRLRTVIRERA